MSLLLASGSSQYLERAGIPSLTYPYAVSAWVYVTVGANGNIVGLFNNGTAVDFEELVFIAPNIVQLRADDGVTSGNSPAVGVALNTWHHILGIWTSASGRRIYLDGVAGTNLASSITPAGLNTTAVGRQSTSAPGNYISGRVAEVAFWDLSTVFTTNEISMLALGVIPSNVRFSELVEYHPMLMDLDPTLELIGASGLTQFGGPIVSGHPPLILSGSPFAHTASTALEISVGNTITFGSVAWDGRIFRTLNNDVVFDQIVVVGKVLNISVGNTINFGNTANNTIEDSAGNTVTFSNSGDRGENPGNTVTFTNAIAETTGPATGNSLTFDNSVTANVELTLVVGNTITFDNYVTPLIGDNCQLHEYQVDQGPALPSVAPTRIARDFITLELDTLNSVDLRNPEFGDTVTVDPRRAYNLSRNGSPNSFRKSTWPNKRLLNFTVRIMTDTELADLLNVLRMSLGKQITYIDPESRSWLGIILNPDTAISHIRESSSGCREYEISLAFRGEPTA